jgi:hypothetical protein
MLAHILVVTLSRTLFTRLERARLALDRAYRPVLTRMVRASPSTVRGSPGPARLQGLGEREESARARLLTSESAPTVTESRSHRGAGFSA